MNILLIALAVIMIWRISVAMKRGIVREALSFINILFAALVLGMVSMIVNAYHQKNFIQIIFMVIIITALSILYSVVKVIFFPAKVITKLPVVSSVDKLFGFVMGVAETIIGYWGLCCVAMYFTLGTLNEQVLAMIGSSKILTMLYQYNLLGLLLENIKTKIGM